MQTANALTLEETSGVSSFKFGQDILRYGIGAVAHFVFMKLAEEQIVKGGMSVDSFLGKYEVTDEFWFEGEYGFPLARLEDEGLFIPWQVYAPLERKSDLEIGLFEGDYMNCFFYAKGDSIEFIARGLIGRNHDLPELLSSPVYLKYGVQFALYLWGVSVSNFRTISPGEEETKSLPLHVTRIGEDLISYYESIFRVNGISGDEIGGFVTRAAGNMDRHVKEHEELGKYRDMDKVIP